jgi:biopolymer transport protein ExbD
MIIGGVNIAGVLFGLVLLGILSAVFPAVDAGAFRFNFPGWGGIMPPIFPARTTTAAVIALAGGWMLVWLSVVVVGFVGACLMYQLRRYPLAKAGAIIFIAVGLLGLVFGRIGSMTGVWSLLELGVGIWALIVLLRPEVKNAFAEAQELSNRPPTPEMARAAEMRKHVSKPAMGLMITSGLSLLILGAGLVILLFGVSWHSSGGTDVLSLKFPGFAFSSKQTPGPGRPWWTILGPVVLLILMCPAAVTFWGAWRMRQLRSYGLAVTGALLAFVTPPGMVLGFIFSLWAIIVLLRRKVKEAFNSAPLSVANPRPKNSTGRVIAIVFASICGLGLLALGVGLLGHLVWGLNSAPASSRAPAEPATVALSLVSVVVVGLALLVVVALVVGLILFLRRKNSSGTGKVLAIGCSVLGLGGVVVLVVLAGSFAWLRTSKVQAMQRVMEEASQRAHADAIAAQDYQAAQARAAASVNLTFGPAIERAIAEPFAPDYVWFDLDTGRSVALSNYFKAGYDPEFKPHTEAENRPYQEEFKRLKVASGADISARLEGVPPGFGKPPALFGLEMVIVPTTPDKWDALTTSELNATLAGKPLKGQPSMDFNHDQTATYLFQTREGARGILQITSFTDNPRGVKIRYKLVQLAQTNPPSPVTNSSPDIQPPAPATNFVTITIATNGVLTLAGEACPVDDLPARLAALTAKQPVAVFLKADRAVSMDQIAAIMGTCRDAGVEQVTGTTLLPIENSVTPAAAFQFRWVAAEGDTNSPADLLPDASDAAGQRTFRVLREVVLSSADVDSAGFSDYQSAQKELAVFLSPRGGQKFAAATGSNIGRRLAIVWNGRVISAPVVQSAITGRKVNLTGRFTDAEAQQLLDVLNHRGSSVPQPTNTPASDSPAPAVTDDLKTRLSAAERIMSFTERDEALAAVARDAAKAGDAALTRQALGRMTAFTARDKATLAAARALLKAGHRAEAIATAQTITSFSQRDAALKELAQ